MFFLQDEWVLLLMQLIYVLTPKKSKCELSVCFEHTEIMVKFLPSHIQRGQIADRNALFAVPPATYMFQGSVHVCSSPLLAASVVTIAS